MSLTTKPRPDSTHKKIRADHHKHNKHYLKTYWPYIPIAMIIAGGLVFDSLFSHLRNPQPKLANYTYYDILESSIGLMALVVFLLRHAFAWRKVWVEGESFVTKHPLLDIGLVAIATTAIVLSHNNVII